MLDVDTINFVYTLQATEDKGQDYSYKYDGSHLALTDDIQVTEEKDIALRPAPQLEPSHTCEVTDCLKLQISEISKYGRKTSTEAPNKISVDAGGPSSSVTGRITNMSWNGDKITIESTRTI